MHNGTRYITINIGKEHESIMVKILTGKKDLTIINYYNSCKSLNHDTLNRVGEQLHGKVLWCGDFNAHSTLGGSRYTDASGSYIEDIIDEKK